VSALLVTGTDTGVGKTFVTCALIAALRRRGRRVSVMKPAETGVTERAEDAEALRAAAADPAPLDAVCPYRLRAPLAPAVAAPREGVSIDVAHLTALVRQRAADADVLLVEGAGGLLVPLMGRITYADLAAACELPLLIVGPNRLGVINQCALTARVAATLGLRVRGFVLSRPTSSVDPSVDDNAAVITELTGLPCLGDLAHASSPEAVAHRLDVDAILA